MQKMKIKVRKRGGGGGGPELKYLDTCSFLFLGLQQGRSAEPLSAELRLHKTLLFPLPRLHNFFFFSSHSPPSKISQISHPGAKSHGRRMSEHLTGEQAV